MRRAYRERLAEPFAREVAELAERPLYGPRERRELDQVYDRLDAKQKALAARLATLAPDLPAEAVDAAVEAAFNETGESLLAQLDAAGLPLATEVRELRVHFRATLVMPCRSCAPTPASAATRPSGSSTTTTCSAAASR